MHVSFDEDPVETEVKGMLTISCIIRKIPTCCNTPIGFPIIIAHFCKAKIPKE